MGDLRIGVSLILVGVIALLLGPLWFIDGLAGRESVKLVTGGWWKGTLLSLGGLIAARAGKGILDQQGDE